jgi:hypothetical protein
MPKNIYQIETGIIEGKKQHWVRYHGANGKILAASEAEKSLGNARKNIAAMVELADVIRKVPMIADLLAKRKAARNARAQAAKRKKAAK